MYPYKGAVLSVKLKSGMRVATRKFQGLGVDLEAHTQLDVYVRKQKHSTWRSGRLEG